MAEQNNSSSFFDTCSEFEYLAHLVMIGKSINWDTLFSILENHECLKLEFEPDDPLTWWGYILWYIALFVQAPKDTTQYLEKIKKQIPEISPRNIFNYIVVRSIKIILDFILSGRKLSDEELEKIAKMIPQVPEQILQFDLTPIYFTLKAIFLYQSGKDYKAAINVARGTSYYASDRFEGRKLELGIISVDTILQNMEEKRWKSRR